MERMEPERLINARILELEDLSPTVRAFTLERLDGTPYPFIPGQHLMVWAVGKYGEFSLCSSPHDSSIFQFAARKLGPLTSYLHGLSIGDVIQVTEPKEIGFAQHRLMGRPIWFVAGGVGLTGLMAQLLSIHEQPSFTHSDHRLFFGLKHRSELLWPARLERWRTTMKIEVSGDGRRLVRDLLHPGLRPQPDTHVLVCGPVEFFEPVFQRLLEIGILPANILTTIWD